MHSLINFGGQFEIVKTLDYEVLEWKVISL